jgi:2-isopropylmalate synthase
MPRNRQQPSPMPAGKYRPAQPLRLPSRRWADAPAPQAAPRWCSVDLRDGNQALIEPMQVPVKKTMFDLLVAMGFKEIEVGFPSASQTDFDFVRLLIDEDLVPDDVRISVLTQARDELIERTVESLRGARAVTVHLYNATAPLFRDVVFGMTEAQCRDLAVHATEQIMRCADRVLPRTDLGLQYSPEHFVDTEPEYSVEVCEAVTGTWWRGRGGDGEVVLNLPATVERYGPHRYADLVERFGGHLSRRDRICVSLHPHNDRGTAVAAAELGVLAGADRVEGCLFGNGERTGNVDLVTLGLNLFSQGVDPQLDFSDIDQIRRAAEFCTQIPVHDRHPYAGDLVYTSFSGSHQDAIRKGMRARRESDPWNVPYLPIDPRDVGRDYQAVIRINSQSGKGGVSFLLHAEHQLDLPRRLSIEFSAVVQSRTERSGEVGARTLWEIFEAEYLTGHRIQLADYTLSSVGNGVALSAALSAAGERLEVTGTGVGVLDALATALNGAGVTAQVRDHHEHTRNLEGQTDIAAYVECAANGVTRWGVGVSRDRAEASMLALLSAVSRTGQPLSSTGQALSSTGQALSSTGQPLSCPEPARVREHRATAGARP